MSLKGRRIAILAERQYEDLELWYPRLRLQEEHAEVVVAGPGGGTFLSKHGYPVEADVDISNLSADVLHGIIVPGGWAPDYLRRSAAVLSLVSVLNQQNALVASICHGGWVLASAGILAGRTVTSVEAIRDDLRNAGAKWQDEPVVIDHNLVTSRKPADLPFFMQAVIARLEEETHPRRNVRSEVDGELVSVYLTTEALQYMVDILNRLPSMKSYRGTEFDPDTHDALTVIRDFASGSDPKGSLEAESIVILDVVLQENGYSVRGNTRLRKVLEYAEVPGLTRNPQ